MFFVNFKKNQYFFFFNVDAAWARAGYLKFEDLETLRAINSKIEGHPTPDMPFVDVATGSLG